VMSGQDQHRGEMAPFPQTQDGTAGRVRVIHIEDDGLLRPWPVGFGELVHRVGPYFVHV
jgi:hypothetical protein